MNEKPGLSHLETAVEQLETVAWDECSAMEIEYAIANINQAIEEIKQNDRETDRHDE